MADLRLTEADFLLRMVADPEGEIALRAFFSHEAKQHLDRCLAAMLVYDQQTAQENAFYANAYQEGFSRLREFAMNQLEKAKQ